MVCRMFEWLESIFCAVMESSVVMLCFSLFLFLFLFSPCQEEWEYAVIALFITFGVPVMAVSLSLVANRLVQLGSGLAARGEFNDVMRMLITEKEIEMLW